MDQETAAQTIANPQEDINTWAYIELFGHSKIAGRVTTRKLGTEVMFQVDVPKGLEGAEFSHSQLFSPKAIFSINPTTEEWCRKFANAAKQYGKEVLPYIPENRQLVESASEFEDPEN
jgi:hypothetical protein